MLELLRWALDEWRSYSARKRQLQSIADHVSKTKHGIANIDMKAWEASPIKPRPSLEVIRNFMMMQLSDIIDARLKEPDCRLTFEEKQDLQKELGGIAILKAHGGIVAEGYCTMALDNLQQLPWLRPWPKRWGNFIITRLGWVPRFRVPWKGD